MMLLVDEHERDDAAENALCKRISLRRLLHGLNLLREAPL